MHILEKNLIFSIVNQFIQLIYNTQFPTSVGPSEIRESEQVKV